MRCGGGVCRQYHSSGILTASGGHPVCDSQPGSAGPSTVDGGELYHASASVHHGPQQCVGGRAFSPASNLGLRMDSKTVGLPSAPLAVASHDRPVCHISESPLYTIFFSLPRSQFHRDGCPSPTVGWVAGVCLSALCSNSGGFEEAPLVLWSHSDTRSSLLAPEAVVPGASGVSGGRSGGSASGSRPVEPAPCPSSASGSVKAGFSCLETIQQFVKSCGFSRHVAKQAALARRPSSRAGYQAKWSVYRQWCTSEGHSISRPSLSKIADFLFWLRRSKHLSVSAVRGYRSMLSAVFRFVLPEISTSPVLHDLLRSFSVEAPVCSITPPSWDLLMVLEYLKSPVFEPLHQASLRDLARRRYSLQPWLRPKELVNFRPYQSQCLSLPLRLQFFTFRSLWLKLSLLCVPSHALLSLLLFLNLRPVYLTKCSCVQSVPCQSMLRGPPGLSTDIEGFLCPLVIQLV